MFARADGSLGVRRLHRLMDPVQTGLTPQLARRPGLDAGMVTVHKAAIELLARAKPLALPLSLETTETSQGQEDFMSLIFPRLDTLEQLIALLHRMLAHELLAACAAVDLRGEEISSASRDLHAEVRRVVPAYEGDRSPGPELEAVEALLSELSLS